MDGLFNKRARFKIKSNNLAITKQIEKIFTTFVPYYLPKHENKGV